MKKYQGLNCILLIDDDDATNFINKIIIQRADIDVNIVVCTGGQQALDYLSCQGIYSTNNEYPQPGIVFLDINMPGMSGWDFLGKYKDLPEEQKAKIVVAMLTTSLNPDDEDRGKSNENVTSFLHKPLKEEMLLDIINKNFSEIK